MSNLVMLYTTWPDAELAREAGRVLVAEGLAGCVNILSGMHSIYAWEGEVEESGEWVMLIKTRQTLTDAVEDVVREMHPYEVPAFMVMPVVGVTEDYGQWLLDATQGEEELK